MLCEEFKSRCDDYIDQELAPKEREACVSHLQSCPACRAFLQKEIQLRQAIRDAAYPVPDGFTESVWKTIQPSRGHRLMRFAATAAACMLITATVVGGTVTVLHFSRDSQQDPLFYQSDREHAADMAPEIDSLPAPGEMAPGSEEQSLSAGDASPSAPLDTAMSDDTLINKAETESEKLESNSDACGSKPVTDAENAVPDGSPTEAEPSCSENADYSTASDPVSTNAATDIRYPTFRLWNLDFRLDEIAVWPISVFERMDLCAEEKQTLAELLMQYGLVSDPEVLALLNLWLLS